MNITFLSLSLTPYTPPVTYYTCDVYTPVICTEVSTWVSTIDFTVM